MVVPVFEAYCTLSAIATAAFFAWGRAHARRESL